MGVEVSMFVLTSRFTVESGIGGSVGTGTLKFRDMGDATGEDDGVPTGLEVEGNAVTGEYSTPPIGGLGTPNSGSQHNIFAEQLSTK